MIAAVAEYPGFDERARLARIVDVSSADYYGSGYQDILTRVPSIRRAREVLGWEPRVLLDEGIRRTLDFYLKGKARRATR
jgi:nucleoside-diphosphate-sugar epimerase